MKTLIASLALIIAGAASAAAPSFDDLLMAIDITPTRAQLDGAWPDAQDRLLAIAADEAQDSWHRIRATSMLNNYPDATTRQALEHLATVEDPEVRRVAVYTAARTFGHPGDAALIALVTDALSDDVLTVRQHAVRSLRWIDTPAADAALTAIDDPDLHGLALYVKDRRDLRLSAITLPQ